jgi:hypothetical protein
VSRAQVSDETAKVVKHARAQGQAIIDVRTRQQVRRNRFTHITTLQAQ